ncbi:hypothetical protein J5N97_009221 [Dioscorea zingiberensis]|uniref:Retrotransposon gag domain-containing protein n=1 Tax=Dioscorea zingiberensis TaxID=325984 RepID=A0A9D5CWS7_9LILI|nr:hypothetical protein J5N97_009221 [Dioscorea zingiberensis]
MTNVTTEVVMCRAFPRTLTGAAFEWFANMPSGTISCFKQLTSLFIARFKSSTRVKKDPLSLFGFMQRPAESLRSYIGPFKAEIDGTTHLDSYMVFGTVVRGRRDGHFKEGLTIKAPKNLAEFMVSQEEISLAEDLKARWEEEDRIRMEAGEYLCPQRTGSPKRDQHGDRQGRGRRQPRDRTPPRDDRRPAHWPQRGPERMARYHNYAILNTSVEDILLQVHDKKLLDQPLPMRNNPNRSKSKKFCKYHQDRGHSTAECVHLKDAIEGLVREGKLSQYLKKDRQAEGPPVPPIAE